MHKRKYDRNPNKGPHRNKGAMPEAMMKIIIPMANPDTVRVSQLLGAPMAINPAMIKTAPTTRYGRAGLGPLFWGGDLVQLS
jgi:hypothetical protein